MPRVPATAAIAQRVSEPQETSDVYPKRLPSRTCPRLSIAAWESGPPTSFRPRCRAGGSGTSCCPLYRARHPHNRRQCVLHRPLRFRRHGRPHKAPRRIRVAGFSGDDFPVKIATRFGAFHSRRAMARHTGTHRWCRLRHATTGVSWRRQTATWDDKTPWAQFWLRPTMRDTRMVPRVTTCYSVYADCNCPNTVQTHPAGPRIRAAVVSVRATARSPEPGTNPSKTCAMRAVRTRSASLIPNGC